MNYINNPGIQWPLTLASLMLCVCAFAQTQPPTEANPYPMPPRTVLNEPPPPAPTPPPAPKPQASPPAKPAAKPAKPSPAIPAATPPATAAPSLLTRPAQPAKVRLASGKLRVEANNSSLSEILRQIAKAGGMKVDGPPAGSADQRIFGSYGPGAPRDVLTELLNGSNYNVMMVGETRAGTPRELTLSNRAAGGVPNPPPQPPSEVQDETTEQDVEPPPDQPDDEPTPPSALQNRVRTPQQILEDLKRMHQQQAPQ